MAAIVILYLLSLYAAQILCHETRRPNIIIIVADDVGYNDISFHGSDEIQTPNIDVLAYQGVILDNYYTDCYGTASSSAMLTGKYPIRMGMQGPSIGASEDRGVPLTEKLLPSYLNDLGYTSHYVGKWTLGKSRRCFLPMKRGFKTFYGCTSSVDYYTYNHVETNNGTDYFGLDLFDNFDPVLDQSGHLTKLLTERAENIIRDHDTSSPLYLHVAHAAAHTGGGLVNLQAPGEAVAANGHIAHTARRLYAGLICDLDTSIGSIISALEKKGMLNNTAIIFVSDNGAPSIGSSRNFGTNLPLRGSKGSPWEGAVRTTAIIWHFDFKPKIFKGLFHVTDWLPTLIAAAGGDIPKQIDGINQWNSIAGDGRPKRHHAIIAIDDLNKWAAFRDGDLKIIIGNVPNTCGYYGHDLNKLIYKAPDYKENLLKSETLKVFSEYLNIGLDVSYALEKRNLCNLNKRKSNSNATEIGIRQICVPTSVKGCLYNITADPEESNDLWNKYPDVVQHLALRLRLFWPEVVPRVQSSFDPRSDPTNNSYVWFPWLEDEEEWPLIPDEKCEFPLLLTSAALRYYMDMNNRVMKQKISDTLRILSLSYVESVGAML